MHSDESGQTITRTINGEHGINLEHALRFTLLSLRCPGKFICDDNGDIDIYKLRLQSEKKSMVCGLTWVPKFGLFEVSFLDV